MKLTPNFYRDRVCLNVLLAGNAAALIATGGPMLILNRPAAP
ncbi:hypothetical protein MJH54_28880 [Salmonella enterica subsp. enterica serovar Montevideo]|nr:hypothetical protein [Salmonella enterica subsp. enterica serovar Montevideo]